MRGTQGSIVILLALSLLLSSCQTLVGPAPAAPREALGSLFAVKEKAVADGRLLKDMMARNPDMDLAGSREKYNDVFAPYNAAIKTIQLSIQSGVNPADYKGELERQVEGVRMNGAELEKYTMEQFGQPRGIEDLVKAQAPVIVDTVLKIWNASKEEMRQQRQNASDALEGEKMVSFSEL